MAVRMQDLKRLMRDKQRKDGRMVEEDKHSKTYLKYSKRDKKTAVRTSDSTLSMAVQSTSKRAESKAKRTKVEMGLLADNKEAGKLTREARMPQSEPQSESSRGLVTYDDESEEEGSSDEEDDRQTKQVQLPADFFDKSVKPAETGKSGDLENKAETDQSAIPEGFFDDPVMDAKVRKVEYRDKMDDEWDAFQKSIKAETQVSEALIEADDVVVQDDRQIVEWTEQRDCLQKVEDLLVKKDTLEDERNRGLKAGIEKVDNIDDNSGSDDDVDFDEFLDWRAKRV